MQHYNVGSPEDEFIISSVEAAGLLEENRVGEAAALALVVMHDRLGTLMPQAGSVFSADERAAIELVCEAARDVAP